MARKICFLILSLFGIWKTFAPYRAYWNDMTIGGGNDFAQLYCAPHLIAGHHLYDPPAMDAEQDRIIPSVRKAGGPFWYVRLPYYAALLWPLSQLPYRVAYYCWQLIALGSIAAFIWVCSVKKLPTAILCCWFAAIPYSFVNGQDVPFLLLYLAGSTYLLRKNLPFAAGLVLSLCLAKFHLILFLPIALLAARRWKLFSGFVTGGLAMLIVSFAVAGWTWPVEWYRVIKTPTVNQNLDESVINLMARYCHGPLFAVAVAALMIVLAVAVVYASRFDYSLGMGVALLAGVVSAFHVYRYDYILLLPLLSLAISRACERSEQARRSANLLAIGMVAIAGMLVGFRVFGYDVALLFPVAALVIARISQPRAIFGRAVSVERATPQTVQG
jgi:hypothetical protein